MLSRVHLNNISRTCPGARPASDAGIIEDNRQAIVIHRHSVIFACSYAVSIADAAVYARLFPACEIGSNARPFTLIYRILKSFPVTAPAKTLQPALPQPPQFVLGSMFKSASILGSSSTFSFLSA